MTRPRPRRHEKTDDLVEAILQARGAPLAYRKDWHDQLVSWFYFDDPPVGAERVASMSPLFDPRDLLNAWREKLR